MSVINILLCTFRTINTIPFNIDLCMLASAEKIWKCQNVPHRNCHTFICGRKRHFSAHFRQLCTLWTHFEAVTLHTYLMSHLSLLWNSHHVFLIIVRQLAKKGFWWKERKIPTVLVVLSGQLSCLRLSSPNQSCLLRRKKTNKGEVANGHTKYSNG